MRQSQEPFPAPYTPPLVGAAHLSRLVSSLISISDQSGSQHLPENSDNKLPRIKQSIQVREVNHSESLIFVLWVDYYEPVWVRVWPCEEPHLWPGDIIIVWEGGGWWPVMGRPVVITKMLNSADVRRFCPQPDTDERAVELSHFDTKHMAPLSYEHKS